MELLLENGTYLLRLLIAALLGSCIGIERDIHGRAAGLRTHLLVSAGAATFMILSESIPLSHKDGDTTRIAAQVVTGIGFLGAGTILKEGFTIRGLTTAACLWVAAAIGMAAGSGNIIIATAVTILSMVTLLFFNKFEYFYKKDSYRYMTIATDNSADLSEIIKIVQEQRIRILYFDCEKDYSNNTTIVQLSLRLYHKGITDKISHILIQKLEDSGIILHSVKWDHGGLKAPKINI